jgi:hypothetical protein
LSCQTIWSAGITGSHSRNLKTGGAQLAGVLIQGTPYLATYDNNDRAFCLQGFYGNPFSMSLLGVWREAAADLLHAGVEVI